LVKSNESIPLHGAFDSVRMNWYNSLRSLESRKKPETESIFNSTGIDTETLTQQTITWTRDFYRRIHYFGFLISMAISIDIQNFILALEHPRAPNFLMICLIEHHENGHCIRGSPSDITNQSIWEMKVKVW